MASPSPSKLLASKVFSIAPYCYEPAEWQGKDKMAVLVLRPSPHKTTKVLAGSYPAATYEKLPQIKILNPLIPK